MTRFKDLIEARKLAREQEPEEGAQVAQAQPEPSSTKPEESEAIPADPQATVEKAEKPSDQGDVEANGHSSAMEAPATTTALAVRTTTGKRSDPNYKLVSFYLQKETHRRAKFALAHDAHRNGGQQQELSELMEGLVQGWLKAREEGAQDGQKS